MILATFLPNVLTHWIVRSLFILFESKRMKPCPLASQIQPEVIELNWIKYHCTEIHGILHCVQDDCCFLMSSWERSSKDPSAFSIVRLSLLWMGFFSTRHRRGFTQNDPLFSVILNVACPPRRVKDPAAFSIVQLSLP